MLEILLYGEQQSGFLDIAPSTVLDFESVTDLFDEDLSQGPFSLPIEIPWTENNRRLMGFAERLENFGTQKKIWVVDILHKGFPEMVHAKLTLLEKSGSLSYTKGKFNASISGQKGLLGTALKNKKMRDLSYGGPITWTSVETRLFATDVMKGLYPQYPFLAFAPVAIENFFDETKNFFGEFLAKDTVNYIISTRSGADDWVFGRPTSANPNIATNPGDTEHIDYRSIPFFQFKWVLKTVLQECGYTISGEFMDNTDFDHAYLFNSTALEYYLTTLYTDANRKIIPADHMPDIEVTEFIKKIFSGFNVYPTFPAINHIQLNFRKEVFQNKKVLDITNRCTPDFSSTYTEADETNGYSLQYELDSNDDYFNDRVKDITDKNLVATVETAANLATLDIGRPFTTDDIVLVEAENMYYCVANATVIPILWDAYSENLDEYKKGNGDNAFQIGISTLCTYVEFDEANALYQSRRRVGCRQNGSYWNNKLIKVKNDFGVRLFYIQKQPVGSNIIPISYNHHRSPAGTILEKYSFALNGPNGLATLHITWQDAIQKNEMFSIFARADKKFIEELRIHNTLQINNVFFLLKKIEDSIPPAPQIKLELVPL